MPDLDAREECGQTQLRDTQRLLSEHGIALDLPVESINLLNTPQFAEPGNEFASKNFGQITNTLNDGRTFRFRLELNF
jgi:hypothetical protein